MRPRLRRIAFSAVTFASCSPTVVSGDAGLVDAGTPDAGRSDAGTDAGYDAGVRDAGGCPCVGRDGGGCMVPPDFPPDAAQYMIEELCDCRFIPVFVCYDETDLRCPSWACFPARAMDGGGVDLRPDGGFDCLC